MSEIVKTQGDGIYIPSPYFAAPIPDFIRNPLKPLLEILWSEKPHGSVSNVALSYRQLAIQFFLRERHKSIKFRLPSGTKELIKAEVALWNAILRVAEKMYLYPPQTWHVHPATTLYHIIKEYGLVTLSAARDSEGLTAPDLIRKYRDQNRQLRDLENPFDAVTHPYTYKFVKTACEISDSYGAEFIKLYRDIVRARGSFVSILKNAKPVTFTRLGQAKKGRKKQKT